MIQMRYGSALQIARAMNHSTARAKPTKSCNSSRRRIGLLGDHGYPLELVVQAGKRFVKAAADTVDTALRELDRVIEQLRRRSTS